MDITVRIKEYRRYLEDLLREAEGNYGEDSNEYDYVKYALDEFNKNFEVK